MIYKENVINNKLSQSTKRGDQQNDNNYKEFDPIKRNRYKILSLY